MIQTKLKTSDLISLSEKRNLDPHAGDEILALTKAVLAGFDDSYTNSYGIGMKTYSSQFLFSELSNMENHSYRKYDEKLFNNILQVLEIPEDRVSSKIEKIPDPEGWEYDYGKSSYPSTGSSLTLPIKKESAAKFSEPINQSNTNLKSDTMTPEQLREKYPEACNIIFKAGMRAGKEAQQGKLPTAGENPEFDNLNAEVNKVLDQTEGKGPQQLAKRLAE